MKIDNSIDFSKPYIDVKNTLIELNEAMCNRNHTLAIELATSIIADTRCIIAAIRHVSEKD